MNRYANVALPCRKHCVSLFVHQRDTGRPVEQPRNRLRKGCALKNSTILGLVCGPIDFLLGNLPLENSDWRAVEEDGPRRPPVW